jgi:hypothetical protein
MIFRPFRATSAAKAVNGGQPAVERRSGLANHRCCGMLARTGGHHGQAYASCSRPMPARAGECLVFPEAEHRPAGAQSFENHLQRSRSRGDDSRSAHDRNKSSADILFSARRCRSLFAPRKQQQVELRVERTGALFRYRIGRQMEPERGLGLSASHDILCPDQGFHSLLPAGHGLVSRRRRGRRTPGWDVLRRMDHVSLCRPV